MEMFEQVLKEIYEIRIDSLKTFVSEYLVDHPRRCYQKPVKVNGWPLGYARTFKIIKVKRRKRK